MIPVGYMVKTVRARPDWLKTAHVRDIYSVSRCISDDFADWVQYWQHNGYWFFDSPETIEALAAEHGIPLDGMTLFFYRAYEQQWNEDDEGWETYALESSFTTNVVLPTKSTVEGYDIVSFSGQTSAECSPLSCNHIADELQVNSHCLLTSFEEAKHTLETGKFGNCELGPYRIFEVHTVEYIS